MASQPQGQRRYPGARPFTDSPEDRRIFCGRGDDIQRLSDRVIGARLLVLFGRSGLGKTSLLMAGLFPRLRERSLLPVPLRLNVPGSPTQIVISALGDAARAAGAELTAGDTGGIWEFLRTSLIWKDDLLLTPVLVFDQFEEIFTVCDPGFRRELADELGAIASGTPPGRLRGVARRGPERGTRLGEQPPDVKILLSLREEYVGTLIEMSVAIPGLFQELVRLAALGEKEAREAICIPAARAADPGEAPFDTPPFEYEEEALAEMLAFLRGKSRIVEPFQLQLLCRRAEDIAAARAARGGAGEEGGRVRISLGDLGGRAGMEGVLGNFYRHVLSMLRWSDRRRARRLCEEGLLSATGNRLMLDQTQIKSDYGVDRDLLDILVRERLLRREQRLESMFYEISHDRLAESIERNQAFRLPKTLRQALRGAAVVAVLTFGALVYWNRQIEQERMVAVQARADAENLVAFLLGESLLQKLRPVGRNVILEEVQGKVHEYLAKSPDEDRPGQLRTRGLALRNEGDILLSQGKLAEAIARFNESAKVFERLAAAAPANLEASTERARALYRLGEALLDQGKISESLRAHREALALRAALYEQGDRQADSIMDLADSYSSVARMLNSMGRPREALGQLDRARALLEALQVAKPRSARLLESLHNAVDNRADALGLIGDRHAEHATYAEAGKIVQEWVENHPLSADARMRQVIAVSRLAGDLMTKGEVAKAVAQYAEINRAVEELVRWDDTNARWRRDYAATQILSAEGRAGLKQYKEAWQAYDKALGLLKGLTESDPINVSLKKDLNWLHSSRGRQAAARSDWRQAAEDFAAAEAYIVEAARVDPAYVAWQRNSVWAGYDLASARTAAGKPLEAAALLRRSREQLSTLIEAAPEMAVLQQDLLHLYEHEVRALRKGGKVDEAKALAREKTRVVATALTAQPASAELLNEAFLSDLQLADEAKAAGRLDEAVAGYQKALDKISRTASLDPGRSLWWENMRAAYRRIGDAYAQGKRWSEAEKAYRDSVRPGMKALEIASHRADLANRLYLDVLSVGDALRSQGKDGQALAEFERAGQWLGKAIAIDSRNALYFDDRRILYLRISAIRRQQKDAEGAQKAFDSAAVAGARALALESDGGKKARYANAVYLAQVEAGDWRMRENDQAGALKRFEAARPYIEQAVASGQDEQLYRGNLRQLHRRIASAKRALGDAQAAETAIRAAVSLAEELERAAGAKADARGQAARANDLHSDLALLAEIQAGRGDVKRAQGTYADALTALTRAAGLDAKNAAYSDSMRALYAARAKLKERAGDTAGAEADWRASAEAGQRAAALGNSALYRNQAGIGLFDLGTFYERAKSPTRALQAYGQAIEEVERAIKFQEDDVFYLNVSVMRRNAGVLRQAAGEVAAAQDSLHAAVRAARRAIELAPGNGSHWQALYLAQWHLAASVERRGDKPAALGLLRDALKNAEASARLLPKEPQVRDDVSTLRGWVADRSP